MGSVAHQITLGRHSIGILMPRVKRACFVLERDQHPDQRAECLFSPLSARMSPSGVFGLGKRAAAADEASSGNAAADDIVAAGWLGKGCVAHSVRALRQLHRAIQGDKQGCERVVWCRDLAYQRCHINVCQGRPEHSSLMREHCLRCSTLPPFYRGKRSHVISTLCVRVRACMQKPTTW